MTLRLESSWVWDVWFAVDDDNLVHAFYLQADRALGDPELRHQAARIGHAVSADLRSWTPLGRALPEAPTGAPDDRATWTGSVVRDDDGLWWMYYTGVSSREDGQVQRVVAATSRDLTTWARTDVLVESDPRWYEPWTPELPELHWRDPWLHRAADGRWHMYVTARAATGPLDGRGVIAHAVSDDLRRWEVREPVTGSGELRQLEVPQLVVGEDSYLMAFCAAARDHSAARRARGVGLETGTHLLRGSSLDGPFTLVGDDFWNGHDPDVGGLYAGRIVRHRGRDWLMGWRTHDDDGSFGGFLDDPVDVTDDLQRLLAGASVRR